MAQFAPHYNLRSLIDRTNIALTIIFWAIFTLSAIPLFLTYFNLNLNIGDILSTINIIAICTFFILEVIVEQILIPQADNIRRDDFIDNSFGSTFSQTASVGYYDTDEINQGIYKAACNLFENCFFSYSLIKAITVKKLIAPAIVLTSIIISAYYGFKEVPFALSLLQALFSATLLGSLVKHLILMARLHTIQDSWINLFQIPNFKTDMSKYSSHIYRYWLQYEVLHGRIPANIPEILFKKYNPQLTQEWIEIKKRYKIN